MSEAQIFYRGELDQQLPLAPGVSVFGSSFDADVVLFDQSVQPIHFQVTLTSQGAAISLSENAALSLVDIETSSVTELTPGQTLMLPAVVLLKTGEMEIRLSGLPVADQANDEAPLTSGKGKGRRFLGTSVAIVCSGLVGVGLLLMPPVVAIGSPSMVQLATPEMMQTPMPAMAPITLEMLRDTLTASGYRPKSLQTVPDGFSATFNLTTEAEATALRKQLEQLKVSVSARIFVDASLEKAAGLVLAMTNREVAGIEVRGGELILKGAEYDPEWRREIEETLMRDIPGLIAMRFEGESDSWKTIFDTELVGVWSGENPYLVMSDGRRIRIGQKVNEDTVFLGVGEGAVLLVSVKDTNLEYVVR